MVPADVDARASGEAARGSVDEAKLLCKRQHGQYQEPEDNVGCTVGGQRLFACHVVNEILQRCDGYFEDGDLVDFRSQFEKRLGPATQEVHGGVRVFTWEKAGILISLKMYDRGVRVGTEIR